MFEIKDDYKLPDGTPMNMPVAVSKIDGSYIGEPDFAEKLHEMGVAAQGRNGQDQVASIGFCEREQKWYGWSHRAMFRFGIGSKVSKGDCAYVPTDWDDLIEDAVLFWTEEYHEDVKGARSEDEQGRPCVAVTWRYSQTVPNEKLRDKIGGASIYPPEVWGRGEWTAKTLEDAKQMAEDFAEGVG